MTTCHICSHGVSAVLTHQAIAAPGTQWVASCRYRGRIFLGFGGTDLRAITELVTQISGVRS